MVRFCSFLEDLEIKSFRNFSDISSSITWGQCCDVIHARWHSTMISSSQPDKLSITMMSELSITIKYDEALPLLLSTMHDIIYEKIVEWIFDVFFFLLRNSTVAGKSQISLFRAHSLETFRAVKLLHDASWHLADFSSTNFKAIFDVLRFVLPMEFIRFIWLPNLSHLSWLPPTLRNFIVRLRFIIFAYDVRMSAYLRHYRTHRISSTPTNLPEFSLREFRLIWFRTLVDLLGLQVKQFDRNDSEELKRGIEEPRKPLRRKTRRCFEGLEQKGNFNRSRLTFLWLCFFQSSQLSFALWSFFCHNWNAEDSFFNTVKRPCRCCCEIIFSRESE